MDKFDREVADMFRRRRERRDAIYRGEHPPSPLDILYSIIKLGDPPLEGSEVVRKTYAKPR
jgi:hypothetical protein